MCAKSKPFDTRVRALDGRAVQLRSWRSSKTAIIAVITDSGPASTYISSRGLVKLRRQIDEHLRAMRGKR